MKQGFYSALRIFYAQKSEIIGKVWTDASHTQRPNAVLGSAFLTRVLPTTCAGLRFGLVDVGRVTNLGLHGLHATSLQSPRGPKQILRKFSVQFATDIFG